jgi:nicotinamide-nucleotide amidase
MKSALIIVGDGLKYNRPFISYLNREIEKNIGLVDMTLFISKSDESISKDIAQIIKNYQQVIIATKEGFELVGKILSTQTNDTLVLKQNMLVPSKAIQVVKNSYKLSHINVLKLTEGLKLPEILLTQKSRVGLYLFSDEKDRFEKLAHVFEIEAKNTKLIDGLYYYSLQSTNDIAIERFLKESSQMITHKMLFGDNLFTIISKVLIRANKTITFAESCTGGLIASELVKNSGVSSIFKGSIVSYANEVKVDLVGVSEDTLITYGAVSKECVKEMLEGVMQKFDSDFSLAVSGVAGPDGGSLEKPVGTIIIGAKKQGKSPIIKKISLKGDRNFIQQSTVFWAFKLLVLSDEKFFFKFMSKTLDK